MPLSFHQEMRQAQTMALTPQMQQALGLLQAPMMELRQKIRQEVDTNPVLELEDPAEVSIDAAREDYAATPSEERDFDEDLDGGAGSPDGEAGSPDGEAPSSPPPEGPDGDAGSPDGDAGSPDGEAPSLPTPEGPDGDAGSPDGEAPSSPAETEGLAALGDEADYLYGDGGNNEYDPDAEERRQFLFDSIPATESLQDHLLAQLAEADLPPDEAAAGREIVGSIDNDGFLRTPLAEIGQAALADLATCERVLARVQTFTPAGVGARDLRECLLLQLRADPALASSPAARLVASPEAFEALAARRLDKAARLAGIPGEDAAGALAVLARLDPAPGRRFSAERTLYVRPELEFRLVDGRWTAILDETDLPRVRISPFWRRRYEQLRAAPAGRKGSAAARAEREERSYLRERIGSGELLLRGIEQRQATLHKVAQAIADAQPGFFERGRAGLRPLTMAQIAEKVGVHETTVSRTVDGKYARTPHGVVELGSLFVGGLPTASGEAASTDSVKAKIRALVDAEDPASPLSDQAIMDRLSAAGIRIARRTVAKYRDALGILPALQRKG